MKYTRPTQLDFVKHLEDTKLDEAYAEIAAYNLHFDATVIPLIPDSKVRQVIQEELARLRSDIQVMRHQRDVLQTQLLFAEEEKEDLRSEIQRHWGFK